MDAAINNILWMNIHVVMWLLYAASAFFCMNEEVDEIPRDVVMHYINFNLEQLDTVSLMCSLGRKYKRARWLTDLNVLDSSNKKRKMVKYDRDRAYRCVMSDWLCVRQDEVFFRRERFPPPPLMQHKQINIDE